MFEFVVRGPVLDALIAADAAIKLSRKRIYPASHNLQTAYLCLPQQLYRSTQPHHQIQRIAEPNQTDLDTSFADACNCDGHPTRCHGKDPMGAPSELAFSNSMAHEQVMIYREEPCTIRNCLQQLHGTRSSSHY